METVWDIGNIVVGVASAGLNAYAGNWGDAAVDAGCVVIDTAAAIIPFVPGGAAALIKAKRLAKIEKGADVISEATEQTVKHIGEIAESGEQIAKKGDEILDATAKKGSKSAEEATETAVEKVKVYRGVHSEHPQLSNAKKGLAEPMGGHEDPVLHNMGDNASEFTSWTTERKVAEDFAKSRGPGGVVLEDKVPKSKLIKSPDYFNEKEVLRKGIIKNATPTEP